MHTSTLRTLKPRPAGLESSGGSRSGVSMSLMGCQQVSQDGQESVTENQLSGETVKVKWVMGDEIRATTLQVGSTSYVDLQRTLEAEYGKRLVMSYQDEEQDTVVIRSQGDLDLALRQAYQEGRVPGQSKSLRIQLAVGTEQTQATGLSFTGHAHGDQAQVAGVNHSVHAQGGMAAGGQVGRPVNILPTLASMLSSQSPFPQRRVEFGAPHSSAPFSVKVASSPPNGGRPPHHMTAAGSEALSLVLSRGFAEGPGAAMSSHPRRLATSVDERPSTTGRHTVINTAETNDAARPDLPPRPLILPGPSKGALLQPQKMLPLSISVPSHSEDHIAWEGPPVSPGYQGSLMQRGGSGTHRRVGPTQVVSLEQRRAEWGADKREEEQQLLLRSSCDRCNSKKTPCDGKDPCRSCRNIGEACRYSVRKKRGRPKGSKNAAKPGKTSLWLDAAGLSSREVSPAGPTSWSPATSEGGLEDHGGSDSVLKLPHKPPLKPPPKPPLVLPPAASKKRRRGKEQPATGRKGNVLIAPARQPEVPGGGQDPPAGEGRVAGPGELPGVSLLKKRRRPNDALAEGPEGGRFGGGRGPSKTFENPWLLPGLHSLKLPELAQGRGPTSQFPPPPPAPLSPLAKDNRVDPLLLMGNLLPRPHSAPGPTTDIARNPLMYSHRGLPAGEPFGHRRQSPPPSPVPENHRFGSPPPQQASLMPQAQDWRNEGAPGYRQSNSALSMAITNGLPPPHTLVYASSNGPAGSRH